MSPVRVDARHFSPDTRAFIELLHAHGVRYLIVGGEAVIFPGRVRLTGDVDFFFANDAEIVGRLFIGVTTLVKNKRAAGRPRDLDDLSYLEDDR